MRTREFSWPLFVHKETQSQWQSHTSDSTQWLYCAVVCPWLCGVFSLFSETSQDPSLWNSSPLGWHMEGHSKVKWLLPVCCSLSVQLSPVCPVLVMACLLQGR